MPTLGELGYPGMEDYTWVGMFVPAGTPPEIVQKLNDAIVRAASEPQIKERLDALAFDVTAAPLRETAAYVNPAASAASAAGSSSSGSPSRSSS